MPQHWILLAATTTTAGKKSSSTSSTVTLIILVVAVVAVYFLFIRPRSQRARAQQKSAQDLVVGDEVQSIGGIRGIVVATGVDGDDVEVQVAPDVVLTFVRRAVNKRPDAASVPSGAAGDDAADDDDDWSTSTADDNGIKGISTGRAGIEDEPDHDAGDERRDNPGTTGQE